VLLRLEDIDPAARRMDVVDPRYGRYLIPWARSSACQARTPWRRGIAATADASGRSGLPTRHRAAMCDRTGRPVYARATVDGLPVLIIGGDRAYAHPLGLAKRDPEPCSFGTRATRIACPCEQPPPCLHGQALYAHVVSPATAPPVPARLAPPTALTSSGC